MRHALGQKMEIMTKDSIRAAQLIRLRVFVNFDCKTMNERPHEQRESNCFNAFHATLNVKDSLLNADLI